MHATGYRHRHRDHDLADMQRAPRTVCYVFAVTLHYGFLSTFVWTSVLSFDIWKNVAAIRHTSTREKDFVFYCVTSWASPVPVVALGVTLDSLPSEFALAPRYGLYSCWISSIWGQVSLFLVPVLLLLLVDVGLYAHIVIYIRKTSHQADGFDFRSRGERSNMALYVKLAMIMGVTWLIGFVAAFVNITAVDIVVIVLIGAQGVYLFVAFKDYEHLLPNCFAKAARTEAANDS
ncbi:hypothetical protein HPB48_018839 [Haemaphysalis longicornis]|uniref:G-protein coupled receptors family 2 profile 2 domain-containing protein n=1 Tax=Haemaphysalis longicornis TaxID=44386 RepID=A0A9J6G0A5_HAELO|nr:hypothetical protein HPB48_018839 [Haemaphysalis longicornis]